MFALLREDGRGMDWLARKTGYSHSHVKNVSAGMFPASPRFRAVCALVFGRPEADLFHDVTSSDPGAVEDVNGSGANRGTAPEVAPIGHSR